MSDDRIAGPIETWVRNPKNIVGVTHLVERGARRGHTECGDSCKVIKFAREQDALLADADAEIARLREALEILLTRIEYGHLDDWKENDVDWFAVERARAALKDA